MSDDVRNASFIGSAINSGVGSFPDLKRKSKKNKNESETKTTETPTTEAPKATKETKALPKTKKSSSKKEKTSSAPVFVKSERVNNNTVTPTKEITTGQKQLNVGKQFQQYSGRYGTDRQLPVSLKDLNSPKNGSN